MLEKQRKSTPYRTNIGFRTYSNDHYTVIDGVPGAQNGEKKSFRKPVFLRQFSLGFPEKMKFDHPLLFQLKACFANDKMVTDLFKHHQALIQKIRGIAPFINVCSQQAIHNFEVTVKEIGMMEMNYGFLKNPQQIYQNEVNLSESKVSSDETNSSKGEIINGSQSDSSES